MTTIRYMIVFALSLLTVCYSACAQNRNNVIRCSNSREYLNNLMKNGINDKMLIEVTLGDTHFLTINHWAIRGGGFFNGLYSEGLRFASLEDFKNHAWSEEGKVYKYYDNGLECKEYRKYLYGIFFHQLISLYYNSDKRKDAATDFKNALKCFDYFLSSVSILQEMNILQTKGFIKMDVGGRKAKVDFIALRSATGNVREYFKIERLKTLTKFKLKVTLRTLQLLSDASENLGEVYYDMEAISNLVSLSYEIAFLQEVAEVLLKNTKGYDGVLIEFLKEAESPNIHMLKDIMDRQAEYLDYATMIDVARLTTIFSSTARYYRGAAGAVGVFLLLLQEESAFVDYSLLYEVGSIGYSIVNWQLSNEAKSDCENNLIAALTLLTSDECIESYFDVDLTKIMNNTSPFRNRPIAEKWYYELKKQPRIDNLSKMVDACDNCEEDATQEGLMIATGLDVALLYDLSLRKEMLRVDQIAGCGNAIYLFDNGKSAAYVMHDCGATGKCGAIATTVYDLLPKPRARYYFEAMGCETTEGIIFKGVCTVGSNKYIIAEDGVSGDVMIVNIDRGDGFERIGVHGSKAYKIMPDTGIILLYADNIIYKYDIDAKKKKSVVAVELKEEGYIYSNRSNFNESGSVLLNYGEKRGGDYSVAYYSTSTGKFLERRSANDTRYYSKDNKYIISLIGNDVYKKCEKILLHDANENHVAGWEMKAPIPIQYATYIDESNGFMIKSEDKIIVIDIITKSIEVESYPNIKKCTAFASDDRGEYFLYAIWDDGVYCMKRGTTTSTKIVSYKRITSLEIIK